MVDLSAIEAVEIEGRSYGVLEAKVYRTGGLPLATVADSILGPLGVDATVFVRTTGSYGATTGVVTPSAETRVETKGFLDQDQTVFSTTTGTREQGGTVYLSGTSLGLSGVALVELKVQVTGAQLGVIQ